MVTLKNVSRRIQVYNLVHNDLAEAAGQALGYTKAKVITVSHDGATGARYAQTTEKSVPSSLTLLAGETAEELPDVVLDCPEVSEAIQRGDIQLVKQTMNEVSHPGAARHSQRPPAKE